MEISAQYQMSPKEVRSGMLAIAPVRFLAIYVVMLLIPVAFGTNGFRRLRATDAVVILMVEVVMVYILVRSQRRQSGRIAVPSTLTLTDETVTLALPTSTVTHRWTTFVRLVSAKHFWLFYTTKQCAMVIPKRAFGAEEQEQIEAFVRRSLHGVVTHPHAV
jgi:hypothetical protein